MTNRTTYKGKILPSRYNFVNSTWDRMQRRTKVQGHEPRVYARMGSGRFPIARELIRKAVKGTE